MWLDLQSFALSGNIKHKQSNEVVPTEDVPALLSDFFAASTGDLKAVAGAADALAALHKTRRSNHCAHKCASRTKACAPRMSHPPRPRLSRHCQSRSKRPSGRLSCPTVQRPPSSFWTTFLTTSLPLQKAHAPTKCIHFIADKRLAQLIDPAKDSQIQSSSWPQTHAYIEKELTQLGH